MIINATSFWTFLPQTWIIIGIILIIIEVFDGNLIALSLISLLSIVLIKFIFQPWKSKRGEKDINIY